MSSTAHFKPFRFGIKTRYRLQSALVRVLLTVCFQASAMQATAQEVAGQPKAAQVRMPALALDLLELANLESPDRLEPVAGSSSVTAPTGSLVVEGSVSCAAANRVTCLRPNVVEYLIEDRARALGDALVTTPPRWIPLDPHPTSGGWRSKRGGVAYSITPVAFFLRAEY